MHAWKRFTPLLLGHLGLLLGCPCLLLACASNGALYTPPDLYSEKFDVGTEDFPAAENEPESNPEGRTDVGGETTTKKEDSAAENTKGIEFELGSNGQSIVYDPEGPPIPVSIRRPSDSTDPLIIASSPDVLCREKLPEDDKKDPANNGLIGPVKQVQWEGDDRIVVYLDPVKLGQIDKFTLSARMPGEADVTQEISATPKIRDLTTALHVWPTDTAAQEFGKHFAQAFYVCDVNFINDSADDLLVYGASLTSTVAYAVTVSDAKALRDANEAEFDYFKAFLEYSERRRPMSFSDVLAVFDYQRESTTRQTAIRWLQFAGTLAAGAGVFVNNTDYPTGVAFFNGIFLPEFEKNLLWDILMHLRNLESRSLKEIEEIPARGQLHRLVFFPRGAILGLNAKKPMYISELWPDAVARAESIAKLGNTQEERTKALAGILAKSAIPDRQEWVEGQIYKDALNTLVAAKQAQEEARKRGEEEDAAEDARKAALRASVSGIIGQILQQKTEDENVQKLIQALVDAVNKVAPVTN